MMLQLSPKVNCTMVKSDVTPSISLVVLNKKAFQNPYDPDHDQDHFNNSAIFTFYVICICCH